MEGTPRADTFLRYIARLAVRFLLRYGSPEIRLSGKVLHATAGSAGYDLIANDDVVVPPGVASMIPTGVRLDMPAGTCALILPRSGRAIAGLTIVNSPGLIDSDYSGEVIVICTARREMAICKGERVAQLIFIDLSVARIVTGMIQTTGDVRGTGGFGSTGIK